MVNLIWNRNSSCGDNVEDGYGEDPIITLLRGVDVKGRAVFSMLILL